MGKGAAGQEASGSGKGAEEKVAENKLAAGKEVQITSGCESNRWGRKIIENQWVRNGG